MLCRSSKLPLVVNTEIEMTFSGLLDQLVYITFSISPYYFPFEVSFADQVLLIRLLWHIYTVKINH